MSKGDHRGDHWNNNQGRGHGRGDKDHHDGRHHGHHDHGDRHHGGHGQGHHHHGSGRGHAHQDHGNGHGHGHHHDGNDCAPCFVAGTLIDTPEGPRAVEDLRAGDLVLTLDNGAQPLRWIGQRTVSGQGVMAPIRFEAGAIGNEVELRFSPQHRIMLDGWRAELLSGESQVLAAAKHLINDRTIRQVPCDEVTYVHIMFDEHQVVLSHGARTESFHPGAWSSSILSEQWDEIVAIFPELADGPQAYGPTARTCLKSWEVRALLA